MRFIITFALILSSLYSFSQDIPVSLKEVEIYEFLEEMAALKLINVQSAAKPWSRKTIASLLLETELQKNILTTRQQKELAQYLKEYRLDLGSNQKMSGDIDLYRPSEKASFSLHPMGFYYGDSLSQFVLKPVWGIQYFTNSNGSAYHRWGGAEFYASRGNWGAWASLRDNHENVRISSKQYLINRNGGNYKGFDYSDMIGGFTYANSWVSVGLAKDYYTIGTNYAGANILSDRAPTYSHVKLHLTPWKWFEFRYMHGFLVSDVIDSTHSYVQSNGIHRDVMHKKFIATNLYTFKPWKTLNISLGNSIIYSDFMLNASYLNPFFFYKSADHSNNSTDGVGKNIGQNSMMFYDISFRGIKHLHLYFVQFIDELKVSRITDPETHNFHSTKIGFNLTNWPLENISFTGEYTRTVPTTYQHDITTTTYMSNSYNMGHFLRDNADQLYLGLRYHPTRNLRFKANFSHERKGEEYGYIRTSPLLTRHDFLSEVVFERTAIDAGFYFEPTYGLHLFLQAQYSNTKGNLTSTYYPSIFTGKILTISTGFNIGF